MAERDRAVAGRIWKFRAGVPLAKRFGHPPFSCRGILRCFGRTIVLRGTPATSLLLATVYPVPGFEVAGIGRIVGIAEQVFF